MAGIIAARLPAHADPRGAVPKLRDVKLEDGWLGDIGSVSNRWATIAPWAEYRGDKSRAAWFPNRAVAFVWRAWQAMDSPVTLEAAASDGSAALPAWSPKTARELRVNEGADVQLSVAAREGARLASVQFLAGDTVLGEAKAPPWQITWRRPAPGVHAVHAIWSAPDGSSGAINPALVLVGAGKVTH
jgi:hypothetical protein